MSTWGLAVVILASCAACVGPFGSVGLNPEVVAVLRDDPATWCIVVDTRPSGVRRVTWWRDPTGGGGERGLRDCLASRTVVIEE